MSRRQKQHPVRAALKYNPDCGCSHCLISEAIGKLLDKGKGADDIFIGLAHGLAMMLAYAPDPRAGQRSAALFDDVVDQLMAGYMAERVGVDIGGPPWPHSVTPLSRKSPRPSAEP